MQFKIGFLKGTFLNGRVAKRIALILFLAALIPTLLMTFLTHRSIQSLVTENAHKRLVETSHSYAMSAFSNMLFARTSIMQIAALLENKDLGQLDKLNQLNQGLFLSIQLMDAEGNILDESSHPGAHFAAITPEQWQEISEHLETEKALLQVLPSKVKTAFPVITLIYPQFQAGKLHRALVAELAPEFVWGAINDYPSDVRVCAYQLNAAQRKPLFCSSSPMLSEQQRALKENAGEWELFLRAEFSDVPWVFKTERQYLAATSQLGNFIGSYGYIGAALGSLLLVALLSLIQIRRTMVPLEQLIEGTRKVAQGNFTQVSVAGGSEFADLADSFNHMASNIQQQMQTLQSLSAIDQAMAADLDVESVINKVIGRVQTLMPNTLVSVAKLVETIENETHCLLFHSSNYPQPIPRIALTEQQVSLIKSYEHGAFISCAAPQQCPVNCQCELRNFLKSEETHHCWVLPIFWQRELCAFLMVGSEQPLAKESTHWAEISELAGRVGVAISAQAREDQLLIQAQYDSLTGLPNRILLQDRLKQAVDYSARTGDVFWLVFLDLDRFKVINDSLGHNAGDLLLTEVANRLSSTVRDSDTVARFGGDEFIVILQGHMDDNLRMSVLRRLMQAVQTPVRLAGSDVVVTCSVGVAVYPTDAFSIEALLRNADVAMYRAKETGKNNFQFFTQAMNDKIADRLRLEMHLRKALENNEFEMHYQPKVHLHTKEIVGLEALIRWNNPALGFLGPQHFIALAEETGLIVPIGEWAIRTACKQAKAWQDAGYPSVLMAVNLSVRQFNQANLAQSIQDILQAAGLEGQYLELELTESLIIQEVDTVIQHLAEMKQLGIKFSIDDFGTGYSSLAYLQRLPIDALKIDKSFVDAIVSRQDSAPIVASIIALAKNLNFKVVAEGVETPEQLAYLIQHGCDEIQGYYFSRPVTANVIEEMFKARKMLTH